MNNPIEETNSLREIVNRGYRGISRIGLLFFLLIFSSALYLGFQIIPFYYYYYEFLGVMESQADKASVFSDAQIRKVLLKKIKELELPIGDPDELKINRFGGKIIIDLSYQEVLYIDIGEKTYDLHVFKFNPHVERETGVD